MSERNNTPAAGEVSKVNALGIETSDETGSIVTLFARSTGTDPTVYIRERNLRGRQHDNKAEVMDRKAWMDTTLKAALIGAAVLMYLDLKAEIRTEIRNLGNKIDRVETKVDEVRGYLKFSSSPPKIESSASDPVK